MYEQEITRRHRTAFVIAIDQSQSMLEELLFDGRRLSKAEAVAEVTNNLLNELVMRARRDDGIRDYYDIALIGYAGNDVTPLIDPKRTFIPVSEMPLYAPATIRRSTERILPDGSPAVHVEECPQWITPRADGDTPMYEALLFVRDMVDEWCRRPQNAESFPPVVFNITDGEASDCDERELLDVAGRIKSLGTSDGNVLLINIHISSNPLVRPVIFPTEEEADTENRYARILAEASSVMPEPFNEMIRIQRGDLCMPPYRGMSFNASVAELVTMLNIGSRSVTDMR